MGNFSIHLKVDLESQYFSRYQSYFLQSLYISKFLDSIEVTFLAPHNYWYGRQVLGGQVFQAAFGWDPEACVGATCLASCLT